MEVYRNFGSDMKLNLYVRVNSVVSLCVVLCNEKAQGWGNEPEIRGLGQGSSS
jgi:hypothetical protein